jgi:uncharacterized protein YyaL (SSP411 family)
MVAPDEAMLRFSPNPNLAHLIDWFEWENEAFTLAGEKDKPVMLFLSAFWCRYCQSMDEQAFSDRENMALLNAYFIALRAEDAMRPDLNARYNLNGWPTIAFFSPGGELLAASNFLSVEEFKNLLLNVYLAYQEKDRHSRVAQRTPTRESPDPPGETAPEAILAAIADSVMASADRVNGGYGRGQKFIYAPVNDFLLSRYELTGKPVYLNHVRLTLDHMREGQIHDRERGGYFRTTTGADWTKPHREKLLVEQAGLLANCLGVFRLTGSVEYARMADEIVGYLNARLFDAETGAFFGCEDFLVREGSSDGEWLSIVDRCVYTDANAVAAAAYLQASALLGRIECRMRALNLLDWLWNRCRSAAHGMYHYYYNGGGAGRSGMLLDQALVGTAMLEAYGASGDPKYLEWARADAEFILGRLKNPAAGFYDCAGREHGVLVFPLMDLDQNGTTATFFLRMAEASGDPKYHQAASWALRAARADAAAYGLDASRLGRALGELLNSSQPRRKSSGN